ncbi:unnamed protein product [Peniophora sp. CBMAI 1063]|nr:unnamed protein product [Peniophora sp. CBMAI 1063]
MQDPTYPLVPIASIVAAVLVLLTLITSGVRGAYNRGVVMFEGWVLVGLIITAVQTIVWRDTSHIIAPVFCDICESIVFLAHHNSLLSIMTSLHDYDRGTNADPGCCLSASHLAIGLTVGIPACSFVITRRLWLIVDGKSPMDQSKLRSEIFIDYFLGLGVPVLSMILYYIVQGVRFQIVENYGCASGVYQSGVAILLLDIWPLVLPLASATLYCWRIVLHLHRHRRTVNGVLRHHIGMDRSRYVRALALGCVDILLSLPVGIISFVLAVGVGPSFPFWPGWSEIHTAWEPLATPSHIWQEDPWFRFRIYWNSWVNVFFGIAIFSLFGLNLESRKIYSGVFGRTKEGVYIAKEWSSGVITSTLVPASQHSTIEIMQPSRESIVAEKRQRQMDEFAELDTLHSLENGFAGAITVTIEVGEEIYRPGGVDGAVPFYYEEKRGNGLGGHGMV